MYLISIKVSRNTKKRCFDNDKVEMIKNTTLFSDL